MFDNWYKEEFEVSVAAFKNAAYFIAITSTIYKIILGFYWGFDFVWTLPSILMTITIMLSIIMVRPITLKYNVFSSVIVITATEIMNFALYYISLSLNEENKAIIIIESTMVLIIQKYFVKNLWFLVFLIAKHIFLWHGWKLLFGNISLSTPNEIYGPFLIVFIHIYEESYRRTKSFDRYTFRRKLEQAEKNLAVILQAFPDGLIVFNDEFFPTFINDKMILYVGASLENVAAKLTGLKYVEGKKFENQYSTSEFLIDSLRSLKALPLNNELSLGIVKIGDINLEWKAKKIQWRDQEALLVSASNANQIIEFEQTSAQNKYKTLILGSISDEIKNPMTEILKLIDQIFDDHGDRLGNELLEKLVRIRVFTNILTHFISNLLDFSQIIQEEFKLHKQEFNIRTILRGCYNLYNILAQKKNIKLTLRIDPGIPDIVNTDSQRFCQIIINLLSNALKFTNKGQIELCALLTRHNELKIMVSDTGIGIPKERLSQLNSPSIGYCCNYSQSGELGLHISKILVQKLGGTGVYISSSLFQGSVFYFTLNLFEGRQIFNSLDQNIENSAFEVDSINNFPQKIYNKSTYPQILIVDDSDFSREVIASFLRKINVPYIEALSGKQAIKQILWQDERKKPVKLVIMDCVMPSLDGWEVSKKIKNLYQDRKISSMPNIVGITANLTDENVIKCYSSGMKFYMGKPINSDIILNTISNFIIV